MRLFQIDGLLELSPGNDYDLPDEGRRSFEALAAMSETERNALGVAALVEPEIPANSRVASESVTLVDGKPVLQRQFEAVPLGDRKSEMLASLANLRWEREVGGMMFGMARVATDDRSKLLAFASRTKAKEDDTYSKRWKVANGEYVDLTAPMLIALAEAIETHVSDCFEREDQLAAAIQSATDHEALDAINVNAGWPQ